MGDDHPDRSGLEKELRRGLADGELTVHYQPEVDLTNGPGDRGRGAGALAASQARACWSRPSSCSSPRRSDLIVAIDDFVLWQACHEAARWRRQLADDQPFVISVNLSERRLAEAGLSNKIAQAISDAELPADSLCLEVAESALLDRRGDALASLPDLEALGVRLLIDDFGVAVSSFSTHPAAAAAERDQDRLLVHRRAGPLARGLGRRRRDRRPGPRPEADRDGRGRRDRRAAGRAARSSTATAPRATSSRVPSRRPRSTSCCSRPATASCCASGSAPARGPGSRCGSGRRGRACARSGREVLPARVALGQRRRRSGSGACPSAGGLRSRP